MRRYNILFTLTALCILFIIGCTGNKNQTAQTPNVPAQNVSGSIPPPPPPPPPSDTVGETTNLQSTNWTYSANYDALNGDTSKYATLNSTNSLSFDFPYSKPGDYATLNLRHKKGMSGSLYLTIDKGQFDIDPVDGSSIKCRFDNSLQTFHVDPAGDGSSNVIFIGNAPKFISLLKKSHHLIIGAPFYENGIQQINFNTDGLNWN